MYDVCQEFHLLLIREFVWIDIPSKALNPQLCQLEIESTLRGSVKATLAIASSTRL